MNKEQSIQDKYWSKLNSSNLNQELVIEGYELPTNYTDKEIVGNMVSACGNYSILIAWIDKAYHVAEYHKGVLLGTSIIFGLSRTMRRLYNIATAHRPIVLQWYVVYNNITFGDNVVDLVGILDGSFYQS